jgi:N-acetylneuraminic acid mutarotase
MINTVHKLDGWKPESREGHTTTIYKNLAIVIGGHCSYPYSLAQVYSFDRQMWVKQFDISSARSYHTSVFYKSRFIIVFGGMGTYDISRKCRICYNTINLIDLQSWTSRALKMNNE